MTARACPMSRSWAKGSTTAWRKLRAFVLERDRSDP